MTWAYLCLTPLVNKIFQQLLEFNAILESLVLSSDIDSMSWSVSSNKFYSMKSCYAILNDGGLRSQHAMDIWKCKVPLKTKVFSWLVVHDKILSRENLAKKDWLGSIVCVFCGCEVKSTSHIFIHCQVAGGVWDFFLQNSACLNNILIGQVFSLFPWVKFNLCKHYWTMLVLTIF